MVNYSKYMKKKEENRSYWLIAVIVVGVILILGTYDRLEWWIIASIIVASIVLAMGLNNLYVKKRGGRK